MFKIWKLLSVLLVIVLTGHAASAAEGFISAADLEKQPSQYLILDARPADLFKAGHIPGAFNAPAADVIAAEKKGSESLSAYLGALGIDGSRPVVVYGAPFGTAPDGRVAFSLKLLGLNSLILDGGMPAWKGNIETEAVAPQPVKLQRTIDEVSIVDVQTVLAHVQGEKKDFTLLDVRRAADVVKGSIPGAKFFSIAEIYTPAGTFVAGETLVKILASKGIDTSDPVVVYCNSGFQAGGVTSILRRAGFENLRIYRGSFNEWKADASRPIAK